VIANSPIVAAVFIILYALAGAAIGMLSGWLASVASGCGRQNLWKNAFLGSLGFVLGFLGAALMPWPRNTITYRLQGGGTVTSTMNSYQHPERVAIIMAIVLPILQELYRLKRVRKKII
jgi:hypothetical protein